MTPRLIHPFLLRVLAEREALGDLRVRALWFDGGTRVRFEMKQGTLGVIKGSFQL